MDIVYDDAQRYITSMANLVNNKIETDKVFIPTNLNKGNFLQCASDNLDFSEDTRDGKTLHATTHIFYQYQDRNEDSTCEIPVKRRKKTDDPTTLQF